MKGYFLVIEGPDGSGKSTLIKRLKNYLDKENIDSICVREPGGTEISEDIRNILLSVDNMEMNERTEALLYAAARSQLVSEVIKPALENGSVVISDRFLFSSLAYQGVGRGLGIDNVMEINKFALGDIYPDRTIFLDVDPKIGLNRNKADDKVDRLEIEDLSFHNQVYKGFLKSIKKYPLGVEVIDGSEDKDTVFKKSLKIVLEDLI